MKKLEKTSLLIMLLSISILGVVFLQLNQSIARTGEVTNHVSATITGECSDQDTQANSYTLSDQYIHSICALTPEKFLLVWTSHFQDGPGYGVFASVFNATSRKNLTNEFQVNSYSPGYQWSPSACALTDETFVVVFGEDKAQINTLMNSEDFEGNFPTGFSEPFDVELSVSLD